jgi:hypothetical protein
MSSSIKRAVTVAFPWLEIGCCAILAALLLAKGILPGWRVLNTDFPNYYLVARLLREGYSLERIYDWVWLQRIKDHWGLNQTLVGFAGLSPFSALPLVPLSIFTAIAAKRLWIIANILFLGASIELLSRVTSLGRRRVCLLALLAVFPLRTSFLYGQMHLLVLLLVVAAYFYYCRGRQIGCAACIALAGALKIYPLLLGGYFLWNKQWRPAFALLCATLVLVGAGYFWFGADVMHTYAMQVLPRSLQGEVLDPYSVHAASGAALFHRLFIAEPALNPAPLLNAPWLYAVLYPLWQLTILVPLLAIGNLEWATFMLALLILSPVPSSYHFVVLIFSIVLLLDVLLMRRRYGLAALAIVCYCLISMVEFFAFARLWLLLLLFAVFLISLWPDRKALRVAPLCAISIAICGVGVLGYLRHFADLQQEMMRRIPTSVQAYLAGGLHSTASGYVFTAMLPQGYRVLDQAGQAVWQGDSQADQLSVAGPLLELADAAGSRVVMAPSGRTLIPDAESPAISPDEKSIAFLRETKGKGALWIAYPRSRVRVTDSTFDVRSVAFAPAGWLMFDARVHGRIGLFRLLPQGQVIRVSAADEDVGAPAISPDGRMVAFTRLQHNRWQLGYMDLSSGKETMLTQADCNAYSPAWLSSTAIGYATDCGRGLGLTALASVSILAVQIAQNGVTAYPDGAADATGGLREACGKSHFHQLSPGRY